MVSSAQKEITYNLKKIIELNRCKYTFNFLQQHKIVNLFAFFMNFNELALIALLFNLSLIWHRSLVFAFHF